MKKKLVFGRQLPKKWRPDRRRKRWCEAIGHHHYREGQFICVLCGSTTCEDDL